MSGPGRAVHRPRGSICLQCSLEQLGALGDRRSIVIGNLPQFAAVADVVPRGPALFEQPTATLQTKPVCLLVLLRCVDSSAHLVGAAGPGDVFNLLPCRNPARALKYRRRKGPRPRDEPYAAKERLVLARSGSEGSMERRCFAWKAELSKGQVLRGSAPISPGPLARPGSYKRSALAREPAEGARLFH
jgi:hypothetical protein